MIPRAIALIIVLAFVLAGYVASKYRATNYGLPLVASALPQADDPGMQAHLFVAPCPVEPMNFPHVDVERKA